MRAPMVIRQSEQTNRRPPLAPPKPPGKNIAIFSIVCKINILGKLTTMYLILNRYQSEIRRTYNTVAMVTYSTRVSIVTVTFITSYHGNYW